MISALVIGSGSYIGKSLLSTNDSQIRITAVPHGVSMGDIDIGKFDVVVNMTYDPRYRRELYDERIDMDLAVARAVASSNAHYVMLSTRRVYGVGAPFPVDEDGPCDPTDHYGRNKLRTEISVENELGPRCTILRLANIFGFEAGRSTFFGTMLDRLDREKSVVLDVSPFVRRDFLHISDFTNVLRDILVLRPGGRFNVGSGQATELGRIALWVIDGYGDGRLIVESSREHDNFLLNCDKLEQIIGSTSRSVTLKERCVGIGRALAGA